MTVPATPGPTVAHAAARRALRTAIGLVGGYLAISVLTLVALGLLRDQVAAHVGAPVWVRTTIVAASACLTWLFAVRAARGSRRDYLRLRIASAVMLTAIILIVVLPDPFPVWLKIEQAACGLLLLGVVRTVNRRTVRAHFARPATR
jgi:hypothetical protein